MVWNPPLLQSDAGRSFSKPPIKSLRVKPFGITTRPCWTRTPSISSTLLSFIPGSASPGSGFSFVPAFLPVLAAF
ncbi:hypothetical protein ACHAXH_001869 [Discostella pseudostelligera]